LGRLNAKLASRNENKLRELARVLEGWELGLLDVDAYPPEAGATYYENALGKASHGAKFAGDAWVVGEDSGLEVEGLGGGPGIRSARFGGNEPVERLLAELRSVEGEGRRARFRRRGRRCGEPEPSTAALRVSRAETKGSATTRSSSPWARSERSRS
jgi:XTP/dITP diphosphohydrolase